jgi:hypothetical protein
MEEIRRNGLEVIANGASVAAVQQAPDGNVRGFDAESLQALHAFGPWVEVCDRNVDPGRQRTLREVGQECLGTTVSE